MQRHIVKLVVQKTIQSRIIKDEQIKFAFLSIAKKVYKGVHLTY